MAGECLLRHPAHEHAVLRRAVGTDARQSTHRAESRGRLRRRAERRERQQEEPEHHVVQAQRPEEESGVGGGLQRRIPRRVGVRRARTIGEAPSQESRRDGQRTRGAGVLRRRGGVRRRVRLQRRRDVEKSNRQRPGLHRPGVLPAAHERLARYVYFYSRTRMGNYTNDIVFLHRVLHLVRHVLRVHGRRLERHRQRRPGAPVAPARPQRCTVRPWIDDQAAAPVAPVRAR